MHIKQQQQPSRRKGYTLMLMIWAVMLMAFTVGSTVKSIQSSAKDAAQAGNRWRCLHLAESGIELGFVPRMFSSTGLKQPSAGSDMEMSFRSDVEEGKMPINYIDDSRARETVYNLLIYWKIDANDAAMITDCLADWVDSDAQPRAQGAEKDYYEGLGFYDLPRQQPFNSLEELMLVKGWDMVAKAKHNWRDYFSIHSAGQIYLPAASKDVLVAATGCAENDAENYIKQRNGDDGMNRTSDDVRMSNSQALSMLAVPGDRRASVEAILTDRYSTRRVESIGRVGLQHVKLTVIGRRQENGSITFLARFEE